ncbi:kinase/pyrophosphorylase [Vibrio sp.]|nr:kinase/pyrophosphorylase [Vibrio sp.]
MNSKNEQDVFYVSDATAITCETLAHSIMGQFDFTPIEKTYPFVESEEKLDNLIKDIHLSYQRNKRKSLVFYTMVSQERAKKLEEAPAYFYNLFGGITEKIEQDLDTPSKPQMQRSRSINKDREQYFSRIAAIEYTLGHDDGVSIKQLEEADLILFGASRSSKTPTSLYMAMQFGLKVVNYPVLPEPRELVQLPLEFEPYRHKLFGLTINSERLQAIRDSRYSNSQYAKQAQCEFEVKSIESFYRREAISYINTTHLSVEEIATRILDATKLERHLC